MNIKPSLMAAATVTIAASTLNAISAEAAVLDFDISPFTGDPATVNITLEEVGNDVKFNFEVTDTLADITGVFFDINDTFNLNSNDLSVSGNDVTGSLVTNTSNLGNGVNLNGGGPSNPGSFDFGLKIGTNGIGTDDIQSTSFTLSHATEALTLDMFEEQKFGVRLQSVGSNREGSSKLTAISPIKVIRPSDPKPVSVPEPSTLLGLGLFAVGLAGTRRIVKT
ncbi:MAG: PEP-CTERM sorting domain-containing protein [Moorea sp. SIO3I7]|nr:MULTISPECIES: PEP-CTERM sorting domain-containing protein [unclassified Moorena]NEO01490.1 PEP-CTERM sorting domain-containing protein [Moorena sp. SIO3I7]NEO14642.1 PEP-CTERM sorting domain-containing protein [Moorena sp. SIO3E8]NEO64711.1 PEP-CTERM sorting domain-containing protein [Moorena sp. SIO4G2]NEQ01900.1 PEP-CTERM sorting domain-containing protein [Moorena sp. SIO3F7]